MMDVSKKKNFTLKGKFSPLAQKNKPITNLSAAKIKHRKKKSKIIFKLKKKKLSVIYHLFSLNKYSILYQLRRKNIKIYLKSIQHQEFSQLRLTLKELAMSEKYISLDNYLPVEKDIEVAPTDAVIEEEVSLEVKKIFKFFLSITVHSNNIFMNLSKYVKKSFKTCQLWSAGMFDFACSKKKIKFAISAMFKEVKLQLGKVKLYTIKIQAPSYLNKYIYKQLLRLQYKPKFFIYSSFKIFNGCRSKKKRRKKRLRFRFFR